MKKTYLTILALLAGATSAFSTIQYTGSSFNGDTFVYATVVSNTGVLIPNGTGYSAIGSFNVDPAGLANPAALAAQFVSYASGAFGGANALDAAGSYSISNAVTTPVDIPGGPALYAVYGNAATLALSTQWAVVNLNRAQPNNPADPGLAAFTTDLVAALAMGSVVGNHGMIVPIVASPTLDQNGLTAGPNSLRLAVVPEPSMGLLSLGSIALLLIRRRRN